MAYCWAALRTLGILIGVFVGLLVLAAIASGVVNAFLYTFETGCLALAFVFGVLAICFHGHSLKLGLGHCMLNSPLWNCAEYNLAT